MSSLYERRQRSKSMTLSAIIKNPKLAKLMEEALVAPLGSTKREQARAVLKSLRRAHDGAGGPGMSLNVPQAPLASAQQYSGFLPALGRTTEQIGSAVTGGISKAADVVGKGLGLGALYGAGKFEQAASNVGPWLVGGPKTPFEDTTYGQLYGTAKAATGPIIMPPLPERKPTAAIPSGPMTPYAPPTAAVPADLQMQAQAAGLTSEEIAQMFSGATEAETPAQQSFLEQWWNKLMPEEQTQFSDLYSSVQARTGPEMFAFNMMANKEALKKLFPSVPETSLPEGASLARQIEALSNRLKEEKNIDTLRNSLVRQLKTGITLPNTLQAFVRGKDEYLNKIDTMIEDTKDKMLDMDLANPAVYDRMSSYMNYLSVLKGRQTQRYADFVNTAVNEHSARIDDLQNSYNQQQQEFENEFTIKTSIVTEDYNRFKTLLSDMYKSVDGMEDNELKRSQARVNLDYTQSQTLENVIKAYEINNNLDWITNSNTYFNLLGIDKEAQKKGETVTPVRDITELVTIANNTKGTSGEGVIYHLRENVFKKEIGNGSVANLSLVDEWMKEIRNYGMSDATEKTKAQAVYLAQTLYDSMIDNMQNYLQESEVITDVRDAISDLTGKIDKINNAQYQQEWINDHKQNVNENVLNEVYNFYKKQVNNGIDPGDVFTTWANPVNTTEIIDRKRLKNVNDKELQDKLIRGILSEYQFQAKQFEGELFSPYQ